MLEKHLQWCGAALRAVAFSDFFKINRKGVLDPIIERGQAFFNSKF
jgi:hypothetical protein